MNRTIPLVGASAARIFTGYGPKPVAETPNDQGVKILERIEGTHAEVKALFDKANAKFGTLEEKIEGEGARLADLEQKLARGLHSRPTPTFETWGEKFIKSEEFKSLAATASQRGRAALQVESTGAMERKAITSISTSGGLSIAPDYRMEPVVLPKRKFVVRDLIAPGQTSSGAIMYPRMTTRTNAAATVGETLAKPYSNYAFELVQVPVQTIAHLVKASRQVLDDAPQLQSTIDSELRYGLQLTEEFQILQGDGTGVNLFGLVPQASAYSAAFAVTGETAIDRLSLALLQAELALLPSTGIILNPTDWRKILMLKDGMGRYIVGDPLGQGPQELWGVPVAVTLAMTAGNFLAGAFRDGAQLFDRMMAEVLVSTENVDDWEKNLCTVRGEERLALAVRRPGAFIYGTLP